LFDLGRHLTLFSVRQPAGFRSDAGQLRQTEHVQNERDLPVAHDRGAGESLQPVEPLVERLDDDLFSVVDLVNHQPELLLANLQHNDMHHALRRIAARAGRS
jgi:hypothetical protein